MKKYIYILFILFSYFSCQNEEKSLPPNHHYKYVVNEEKEWLDSCEKQVFVLGVKNSIHSMILVDYIEKSIDSVRKSCFEVYLEINDKVLDSVLLSKTQKDSNVVTYPLILIVNGADYRVISFEKRDKFDFIWKET